VRIVSRLCRWLNPNWIDAYAVGWISDSRRPLQNADGEMTHHPNGNNRDAPSKKGMYALSFGTISLFLVCFASELPFVGKGAATAHLTLLIRESTVIPRCGSARSVEDLRVERADECEAFESQASDGHSGDPSLGGGHIVEIVATISLRRRRWDCTSTAVFSSAGNCRTVACWPSHSHVSSTIWPSGNSNAL